MRVKKINTPNQDSFALYSTPEFIILCVCDGHGKLGHCVATPAAPILVKNIIEKVINSAQ